MIWLPGVVGAEAEAAQEAGVGGWPQGPECLLFFFLFCTKANCTCFIFLREDCRQLEIAAFCLHILKNLGGWRGRLLICRNRGPSRTPRPSHLETKFSGALGGLYEA